MSIDRRNFLITGLGSVFGWSVSSKLANFFAGLASKNEIMQSRISRPENILFANKEGKRDFILTLNATIEADEDPVNTWGKYLRCSQSDFRSSLIEYETMQADGDRDYLLPGAERPARKMSEKELRLFFSERTPEELIEEVFMDAGFRQYDSACAQAYHLLKAKGITQGEIAEGAGELGTIHFDHVENPRAIPDFTQVHVDSLTALSGLQEKLDRLESGIIIKLVD